MVLEGWGVGDAAVEVLRHPLLSAQYPVGLRWKKADSLSSQSRKYLWTEQWREADASYIWVRLSPHFVSLGLTESDWCLWYAIYGNRCLALEVTGKPSIMVGNSSPPMGVTV